MMLNTTLLLQQCARKYIENAALSPASQKLQHLTSALFEPSKYVQIEALLLPPAGRFRGQLSLLLKTGGRSCESPPSSSAEVI